nr:hypothetical protein [Psychrobacter sp. WY6]
MSEIKHILQQITALSDVPDPAVLKRLIDELRVSDKAHISQSKHSRAD